ERKYYLLLSKEEKLSFRELDRQITSAHFERKKLGNQKLSPVLREFNPRVKNVFKDTYVLDFLDLPELHTEKSMQKAIVQNMKKPHENPSIGVLLCKDKDEEVVEYALNRHLSPTLVSQYTNILPDKKLLQAKLHELYNLLDNKNEGNV